jgi:hypothetical protein
VRFVRTNPVRDAFDSVFDEIVRLDCLDYLSLADS